MIELSDNRINHLGRVYSVMRRAGNKYPGGPVVAFYIGKYARAEEAIACFDCVGPFEFFNGKVAPIKDELDRQEIAVPTKDLRLGKLTEVGQYALVPIWFSAGNVYRAHDLTLLEFDDDGQRGVVESLFETEM